MIEIPTPGAAPTADRRGVMVVSAVACAVAVVGAWLRPVWHDELYTLAVSRLPLDRLFSALVVDSGPPLHYLIAHALFILIGWQEGSVLGTLVVRLPSVLAFTMMPWVVWSARPEGARGFIWGPVLVVVWLPLVYFGTEARAYAPLALVNALLWIRGPDWITRGGRGTIGFTVAASCLPLLHYAGFASFLALPALALFLPAQRRLALIGALAAAALPALAWLPVMLGAPQASMAWVETATGPGRPGLATLSVLAPAGPFPTLFEASAAPVPTWVSSVILGGLFVGAAMGARRLMRNGAVDRADVRNAARFAIGVLPAVGLGVAALGGVPLYFAGRTESMVWALAAALAAILLAGLPPPARRVVAGAYAVVGAATVALWVADLPRRSQPPGVEVGRELASRIEEHDRVVVAGLWQLEVRHGLAEKALEASSGTPTTIGVQTVPGSQAAHPGWLDLEAVTSPLLVEEARAIRDRAAAAGGRVWLVWSPGLPLEENFFPAFEGWQRGRVAGSPIIAVDLLAPPPATVLDGHDPGAE